MSEIKRLDPITANQIAAGEVVERPVSVVKELVENSIDAGSTRIDIEVREGGASFIRITDNGSGIRPEEAVLAFERHATSKITSINDLYQIATLGFRGEALPSIASVARVELITRTRDQVAGTLVAIEGGKLLKVEETGAPPGTTLIVRDLFFNTPARRKHLRSPGTEGGLIAELIARFALAYPALAFTFTQNGRLSFQSSGSGDLLAAIVTTQGIQNAKSYLPIAANSELFSLEGFIGKPESSRANRTQQILFVNGRYVKSKLISRAVEEAYHTLLTVGRFPVYILNLRVNPHLVDVNVHPTKMEIRFSEVEQLEAFILQAVHQVLDQHQRAPLLVQNFSPPRLHSIPPNDNTDIAAKTVHRKIPEATAFTREQELQTQLGFNAAPRPESANCQMPMPQTVQETAEAMLYHPNELKPTVPGEIIFAELQVLGQVDATYIIATGPQGLYLFDQHAVAERIQYEQLLQPTPQQAVTQALLIPISVELSSLEAELVIANILLFHDVGFILEHFGGNAFLIRSVPPGLANGSETQYFLDLLDHLKTNNHYQVDKLKIREEFLILHACKSALKAKQPLSKPAMEELINQLGITHQPFTCPHGRPTMIKYTGDELAKFFKRT